MREIHGQPVILWALVFFFLGLGFTARVDIPLAVLALCSAFAFNQPGTTFTLVRSADHWPLLVFLLAALVATVFSVDPLHSLRVQPQFLPALLCYAIITTFVTTTSRLRFVCLGLLFSGLLTSIFVLLATIKMRGADPLLQVRLLGNAMMIVPNDVLLMSVIAPIVLGLAWQGRRELRWLAALYILVNLLVGALVQSRQAVILLLFGLVVVATIMRPRWCVPILLVGIVVGAAVDALLGWPLAGKIFMFPRAYVWHSAWVMFLDRPWTGHGPGMFNELYFVYLERAGYVLEQLGDRRTMPWAHNLFLEQLAERGVQGLLAMLVLLASSAARAARFLQGTGGESLKPLRAGIFAGLMVMIAAGIGEATLTRLWVAVMLFCLVALCLVQSRLSEGRDAAHPAAVTEC